MKYSTIQRKLVGFISVLLMTAVGSAGIAATGENDTQLRVAYQDRVGDASAVIAAEILGESENFIFEQFSSGSMTAEALITGNADIATMGDAVAVSLISRYPDLVTVIGIHGGGEERHKIVSTGSDINTIGIKFGTSTHAALLAWLEERPEIATARLVDLSPSLQLSALAAGEIDALAASEPTPSIALSSVPGTIALPLAIPGKHYPLVVAVSRRALQEKESLIAQYIKALEGASLILSGGGGETLQLLTEATGLETALLQESLSSHFFGWFPVKNFIGELDALAAFLLDQGRITRMPEWN